jgi:Mn2+/Fe2+ NRAMP family transporter
LNALNKIYWLRVALGAIAGLVSTSITILTGTTLAQVTNTSTLLNGITIALLFYLISFYVLKAKYSSQIEKKSKIMSMGIFIYFFTWLIVWVLTLTAYIGPL